MSGSEIGHLLITHYSLLITYYPRIPTLQSWGVCCHLSPVTCHLYFNPNVQCIMLIKKIDDFGHTSVWNY